MAEQEQGPLIFHDPYPTEMRIEALGGDPMALAAMFAVDSNLRQFAVEMKFVVPADYSTLHKPK